MLDDLTKRVSWALETIKEDRDLDKGINDVELAKILGTNKNTLAGYRQGKGFLKSEVVERLVDYYHFNPQWLFKGEGEPFPGARTKYPDVCGPEESNIYKELQKVTGIISSVNEPAAAYPISTPSESGIEPVIQAMSDLKDIFSSGDPILVPAIQWNLSAFKRALLREQQFAQLVAENKRLNERLAEQDKRISELERKIEYLTNLQAGPSAGASS